MPRVYSAQRGREARITAHMRAHGFELQNRFVVQQRDTFDLIYVPARDYVAAIPQGGHTAPAPRRPATATPATRTASWLKGAVYVVWAFVIGTVVVCAGMYWLWCAP